MAIHVYIKKLRESKNFSQQYIADFLGRTRQTYTQIENGKRDITLGESKQLAELFEIPLDKFITEQKATGVQVELQSKAVKKSSKPDIRISVPQGKVEKFKEVLLYILEKSGAAPHVGQTVLYKLLYFIDFDYYEKYEEQLIGAKYIKNHFGPTPVEFKDIVEKMEKEGEVERVRSKYFQYDQKKYLPRKSPDLSILSGREIQHIDNVLSRLADKSAKELSDYSHGDIPWKSHKNGEIIDYESVFYRDDNYSVREYEDKL